MERAFEQQLEELSALIQRIGGHAEEAIGLAVRALVERDPDLAQQVIDGDENIDRLELEADQLVMQILARYQLAARDLRFIVTVIKIVPELERVGDQAVNIAERALELMNEPPLKPLVDLPKMADRAQEMIRGALDAFDKRDTVSAREIIAMDEELDHRTESIFRELVSYMMEDPKTITRSIRLTFLAKYFERIGDQATNMAEQVIYMAEGKVVKHPMISRDE